MIAVLVQRAAWVVSLAALLVACGEEPATVSARDSAGIRITTIGLRPTAVPEWHLLDPPLVQLTGAEAGDTAAFANVTAVRWLPSGRLVVADAGARRLLVYDSTGAFVRSLGRAGDGPGEFRRIATVTAMPGDSIAVFDATHRRVSVWHPEVGPVRSVTLTGETSLDDFPQQAWPWGDSLIVVQHLAVMPLDSVPPANGVRRWPQRARLTLRHATTGALLRRGPSFDGTYTGLVEQGDVRLPFAHRHFVAVGRDRVCYGSGARFVVTCLGTDFEPVAELHWPRHEERLTKQEVDRLRAESRATARGNSSPAPRNSPHFAREILPEIRPAIGRLLIASDGSFWVERFEPIRMGASALPPGDRWTILTADGRPHARLVLPGATQLEDVRGERVVVVHRDSLGVQRVTVHAVGRE